MRSVSNSVPILGIGPYRDQMDKILKIWSLYGLYFLNLVPILQKI